MPDFVASSDVDGWDIALAVLVLVAAWLFSRMTATSARRLMSHLDGVSDNQRALVARVSKYFVLVLGIGISISILGAPIQPLLAAAIVVAVVVALALRGVADNFGAGVVIQTRKPIRIGDLVESMNFQGRVVELNSRSVVIDTSDGRLVHLPNSELLSNPLVNLSVVGRVRCTVRVRADWPDDPQDFVHVLTDVTRGVAGVFSEPSPQVLIEGIEPDRLRVMVRLWHEPAGGAVVASAATQAIADALRRRGVAAAVEASGDASPVAPPGRI